MLSYMSPSSRSTRERLNRRRRQRVLEQPFQEYDLVVEQAVAGERRLHLRERHGEILARCAGGSAASAARLLTAAESPQTSPRQSRGDRRSDKALSTARIMMQAPPRHTPVSMKSPGTPLPQITRSHSLRTLFIRLAPIMEGACDGQSQPCSRMIVACSRSTFGCGQRRVLVQPPDQAVAHQVR